ncbi:MAG TPA: hypothetical protein ENH82_09670 [bacterium]|nr:hypothetical protein [bacterium]
MEHTKGELEVKGIADKRGQCDRYVLGTNKMALVMTIVSNTQANANRLVKCWNMHDGLVEALEAALEFIGRSNKTDFDNEITPILIEVLAKAKE